MTSESARIRRQYTSDVVAAVQDYVERGGQLSFRSERDGATPLAIRFVFADAQSFDAFLSERMTISGSLGTAPTSR